MPDPHPRLSESISHGYRSAVRTGSPSARRSGRLGLPPSGGGVAAGSENAMSDQRASEINGEAKSSPEAACQLVHTLEKHSWLNKITARNSTSEYSPNYVSNALQNYVRTCKHAYTAVNASSVNCSEYATWIQTIANESPVRL